MMRFSVLVSAVVLVLAGTTFSFGQDYQRIADETAWSWSGERATILDSFLRFSEDYQVELVHKKGKHEVKVRVLDNGKELYAWDGQPRSVFASSGDVLVYADLYSSGCVVVAYDLKKQKELWKTTLKGLGPVIFSQARPKGQASYSNSVNLDLINNDAVRVFGNEDAGQYLEIVDLKTGKTVANRKYKK